MERRTEKQRSWPAWSGTVEEIKRLADVTQDVYNIRRAEIASQQPDSHRAQVEATYTLSISIEDGDDVITGPISSALAELDRRTASRVSLIGGAYEETIRIDFTRKAKERRVSLRISSSSQGWARQAFAQISEQVDKGVPDWAWVHKSYGIISLWGMTYLIFAFSLGLSIPREPRLAYLGLTLALPLLPASAASTNPVRQWVFPVFEIVGEGIGSTGSRRLLYLFTLLLSVITGVFVNLIS